MVRRSSFHYQQSSFATVTFLSLAYLGQLPVSICIRSCDTTVLLLTMARIVSYTAFFLAVLNLVSGQNPLASRSIKANTTCVGVNAIAPGCKSNESLYYRDFFYIGGRYVEGVLGNLTYDQIYVEKLSPVTGITQPKPIIFFHGGGLSP